MRTRSWVRGGASGVRDTQRDTCPGSRKGSASSGEPEHCPGREDQRDAAHEAGVPDRKQTAEPQRAQRLQRWRDAWELPVTFLWA